MTSTAATVPFYLQPKFLYLFISFVNLLNFVDRGIIPGATNEINTFIEDDLNTDKPDVYLGLLQSSFVIGYMIGSIIFGHLIHHYGRFFLTATGCSIWIVAVFLSGFSYYSKAYLFLLFARILSGFGEAGLQCTIPPWIQNTAPANQRGMWLSIFYTAIPVGTALGYAVSSVLAESIGWNWAFFIEGIIMIPLVLFMFWISPHFPCETVVHTAKGQDDKKALLQRPGESHEEQTEFEGVVGVHGHHHIHHPTMWQEFVNVMTRNVFLCITAAYAAQAAALIGVSTFGSSFLMGLGFFNKESQASTLFGILISLAGVISTPLGGILLDKILERGRRRHAAEVEADAEIRRQQLAPLVANSDGEHVDGDIDDFADREEHPVVVRSQLGRLSLFVAYSSLIGSLLLCTLYFIENAGLYLFVISVGSGFIFMCNSAINMGVMLSVPVRHRSFAIALNVVFLHGFGDVPSPVIVGLIKDSLAPGCIPNDGDDDDGNIAASDACRDDAQGLRATMLLTTMWLLWTAFFFYLAWWCNRQGWIFIPCVNPEDMKNSGKSETQGTSESSNGENYHHRPTPGSPTLKHITSTEESRHSDLSQNPLISSSIIEEEQQQQLAFSSMIKNVSKERVNSSNSLSGMIINRSASASPEPGENKSRIVSAEEYRVGDSEEHQRSIDRFKRVSRDSAGSQGDDPSPKGRRKKGQKKKEGLLNRFENLEDTIDI